ncbi:MAG: DinB family protein [Ferruginibacter sp.]
MKKLLLFSLVFVALSFTTSDPGVSKKEKKSAAKFLKETEDGVLESVKGLSMAQLQFKPAPDKWSVEECMKHIAASEMAIWEMTKGALSQAATPEKRTEIKMSDEDVKMKIQDRTSKIKTFPPLEPQNTPFKTMDEAITSFKDNRAKLVDYIKNTDEDLRNHLATLPFGSLDCYQMVLFIGAHSARHMKQIEEVKADPNFPKQ